MNGLKSGCVTEKQSFVKGGMPTESMKIVAY